MASMCLGLLVSALVSTSEKAMPILVLLTMAQVILSGGVVSLVNKPGLEQLAYDRAVSLGFRCGGVHGEPQRHRRRGPGSTDPLWAQTPGNWLHDMGMLLALAVIFTLFTWLAMRRLGPRRRK